MPRAVKYPIGCFIMLTTSLFLLLGGHPPNVPHVSPMAQCHIYLLILIWPLQSDVMWQDVVNAGQLFTPGIMSRASDADILAMGTFAFA